MELLIKKLTDDAIVPAKAHATDSGFDLFANETLLIKAGKTEIIKTGIAIQLPENHEAQVRPKSGITSKTKLRVQLGTVDEGYTGELGVIIDNISEIPDAIDDSPIYDIKGLVIAVSKGAYLGRYNHGDYLIQKGDKIAQLVVTPVSHPTITVVDDLNKTERGSGGFGSTGVTANKREE